MKWLKYFLIFLGLVAGLILTFAAVIYFQVDTRVKVGSVPEFSNKASITTLDSIILSPDSVTTFIEDLVQKAKVEGMGISIINNHQLVYQRYFGLRNKQKGEPFVPGTMWYAASFSKIFLGDIATQFERSGELNLDTPLYKYLKKPLPEYHTGIPAQFFGATNYNYADLMGDETYKKVTARMCLTHTSGLPNWRWIEPDRKLKFKYQPGERYSYSGEGMFLLQLALEEISGKDFEEIAVGKVFTPLDLPTSSFVWQKDYEEHYAVGHDSNGNVVGIRKDNTPNAAGSLTTTLEEYTKYFMALLNGEKKYHEMMESQVTIRSKQQFGPNAQVETSDNDSIKLSYGLGVGIYQTPYGKAFFKEGHDDGWQHYSVGVPDRGMALIIMSNSDNGESVFNRLIEFATGNRDTPWYWEGYNE